MKQIRTFRVEHGSSVICVQTFLGLLGILLDDDDWDRLLEHFMARCAISASFLFMCHFIFVFGFDLKFRDLFFLYNCNFVFVKVVPGDGAAVAEATA